MMTFVKIICFGSLFTCQRMLYFSGRTFGCGLVVLGCCCRLYGLEQKDLISFAC